MSARYKDIERKKKMAMLYNDGISYKKIGEMYGISEQAVHQLIAGKFCISRKGGWTKKWDFSKYDEIIKKMRAENFGILAIAEAIGINCASKSWDDYKKYVRTFPRYGHEGYKKCPTCGLIGDKDLFYKSSTYCKKCSSEYHRKKYAERRSK